jgi:hypothetical protein
MPGKIVNGLFLFKKKLFPWQTVAIASRSVSRNDAVAGDEERNGIGSAGGSDCTGGVGGVRWLRRLPDRSVFFLMGCSAAVAIRPSEKQFLAGSELSGRLRSGLG